MGREKVWENKENSCVKKAYKVSTALLSRQGKKPQIIISCVIPVETDYVPRVS